jgi:tight adherence protein B
MIDIHLLLAGFAGLIALGLSALLVNAAREREKAWQKRVAHVIDPHRRKGNQEPVILPIRLPPPSPRLSWERLWQILGIHPERRDEYKIKWWVILIVTFLLARLVALGVALFLGKLATFLIPLFWVLISRQVFGTLNERRRNALIRQLPDAVATIVRSLRVGIPVSEGIRLVARESPEPTRTEFGRLANAIALGQPLEEALGLIASHTLVQEYRFFATVLTLQNQTGGALAETLENFADVIRRRLALRERGHALAAEAKMSAAILTALPVLTLLALFLLNPGYVRLLFFDPSGNHILGVAILMLGGGLFTMRNIIRRSLE